MMGPMLPEITDTDYRLASLREPTDGERELIRRARVLVFAGECSWYEAFARVGADRKDFDYLEDVVVAYRID